MPQISRQTPARPAARPGTSALTGKRTGVLDRIRPIGFDPDEGIKMLLYGRSGTGKTSLWATFPGPILAVICSGSRKPGELRSIDTDEYRNKVQSVTLERAGEMKELTDSLMAQELSGQGGYATVVLDHVTGFQDLALKDVLGVSELPEQKGWGLATQQQWGQCTSQCKDYLRDLISLKVNVVVVAQDRVFTVGGDGDASASDLIQPTVGAAVTPTLAGWLNASLEYIVNTFIRQKEEVRRTKVKVNGQERTQETRTKIKGQVEYVLRCEPDPVYHTKFRVPRGTPLRNLVDADYAKILALVKGGTGKSQ